MTSDVQCQYSMRRRLSAHSEHVVLDPAMKSGSCPKASCSRESRQLRVSLPLPYGFGGRVGEEERCVPVLDAGWTYVFISRVEVHGRVMVSDALGLLFLATLATVNASACLCHVVSVGKLFAIGRGMQKWAHASSVGGMVEQRRARLGS